MARKKAKPTSSETASNETPEAAAPEEQENKAAPEAAPKSEAPKTEAPESKASESKTASADSGDDAKSGAEKAEKKPAPKRKTTRRKTSTTKKTAAKSTSKTVAKKESDDAEAQKKKAPAKKAATKRVPRKSAASKRATTSTTKDSGDAPKSRTLPKRRAAAQAAASAPEEKASEAAAKAEPVKADAAPAESPRRKSRSEERAAERPRLVIDDLDDGMTGEKGFIDWLKGLLNANVTGPRKPKLTAMASYSRKLSSLITAGVPLVRALRLLGERTTENRDLKAASFDVARAVERGSGLGDALEQHPNIFDSLFVGVVRTGEAGGILEDSLRRLSEILERKASLKRRLTNALIYPSVLILIAVITVVIIMVYVVPVFMNFFNEANTDLPLPTKVLIFVSEHLQTYWIWEALILVGLFVYGRYLIRTREIWRRRWESMLLKMFRFGHMIRLINSARFSRTMGGLLSAGVPLWEGLGVAVKTSESLLVTESVQACRDAVEEGRKLEPALRNSSCFLDEFVDVVGIGEETGMLERMLIQLSEDYEEEVRVQLDLLLELIKPLLLIVLALIIVMILLGVYLPYWEMVTSIGG